MRVNPEAHTVVWPNGADFDPATLHDWPEYESAWIAQAQKWVRVAEDKAGYGTETGNAQRPTLNVDTSRPLRLRPGERKDEKEILGRLWVLA